MSGVVDLAASTPHDPFRWIGGHILAIIQQTRTHTDSTPEPTPTFCSQLSVQAELIELRNDMTAEDLVCRLLVRRGIYTRTCDDKKGLEPGKFIRVASRCRSENRFVLRPSAIFCGETLAAHFTHIYRKLLNTKDLRRTGFSLSDT